MATEEEVIQGVREGVFIPGYAGRIHVRNASRAFRRRAEDLRRQGEFDPALAFTRMSETIDAVLSGTEVRRYDPPTNFEQHVMILGEHMPIGSSAQNDLIREYIGVVASLMYGHCPAQRICVGYVLPWSLL